MRRIFSTTLPRVLLGVLLLSSMLASSACRPSLAIHSDVEHRSSAELRQAAKRDLQISMFFQVVSLGLYAWAVGNDSVSDGDQEILVTSAALSGLLSFGALYNGVLNSMEAQQRAALRSDETLEAFARQVSVESGER